jgi:tRNA pseudouridine55 synthase
MRRRDNPPRSASGEGTARTDRTNRTDRADRADRRGGDRGSLCGLLVVDKPAGPTSMAVVAEVRRRASGARTGHAGTLDPLATGVLVLAVGAATKSLGAFMATDKTYRTTIDLSAFTETDDAEGAPLHVEVARAPAEAEVRGALARFTGEFLQRPPDYSAVKVGGRRAYRLARRGERVEHAPRPVTVHRIDLLEYSWPILEIELSCAHGFYVRGLARDLGEALATGGFCRSIRRTAVGPFTLDRARPLDQVPDPLEASDLLPLDEALARIAASRAR